MKKWICALLLLCMVATCVLAAFPAMQAEAAGDELRNVALGCPYTGTAPFQVEADKNTPGKYSYKNFKELTDGIEGTVTGGSEWYVFWKLATIEETIDLGKTVDDIISFRSVFAFLGWGDKLPLSVKVSVSTDNKNFTEVGEMTCTQADTSSHGVYDFELQLPENVSARYVRVTIQSNGGAFVFLSEIYVYAGYVDSFSFTNQISYEKDGKLYGIFGDMTVDTISSFVNSVLGVTVKNAKGAVKTSGAFATGDVIEKTDRNGNVTTYTVIVDGDLDGNGKITASDYLLLKRHCLRTVKLAGNALDAADCLRNGKVDASDYFILRRHILHAVNMYEQYIPDPTEDIAMSYEIPDNYYDKYENTFGVSEFESMQLNCKDSSTYELTYTYSNGAKWMASLVKKRWGVWMLGTMQYTRANGTVETLIGPSTDYEWVMTCGLSKSSINFRGGNHGDYTLSNWSATDSTNSNDRLLDITFYDATTGKKLDVATGKKISAKGIYVVLHTNIYESEYKRQNVIINVQKIYLFNGSSVKLDSNLYFGQDTYFSGNSYSCMMPITKSYGNYARFYCDDGSTRLYKTPTYISDSSKVGGNLGYVQASRVELWGENKSDLHMTIQVHNPETQFLYSGNKTFLWNINAGQNKLYFSMMGAASGDKALVKDGTTWNFKDSWTFSYQPDFKNPPDSEITQTIGF